MNGPLGELVGSKAAIVDGPEGFKFWSKRLAICRLNSEKSVVTSRNG